MRYYSVIYTTGKIQTAQDLLEEGRIIWSFLKLRRGLTRAGKAPSEWRLPAVGKDARRDDEAKTLSRQALVELRALSGIIGEEVTDRDLTFSTRWIRRIREEQADRHP